MDKNLKLRQRLHMKLRYRPRRLRRSQSLRDLVAENSLRPESWIYPVFIEDGLGQKTPLQGLPGQFRWSLDELMKRIPHWAKLGLKNYALFPKIAENLKDPSGKEALNSKGFLPTAVRRLKDRFPDITIFTDVALDPYSSDGHDGILRGGIIVNDESVEVLTQMALVHAEAGADFVAPSDMMDGRVRALRKALEAHGFSDTGILAYSAKYASSFYGPFREALDSSPRSGDKKTYQMDPRNSREALREIQLDIQEGADIVMVKPALSYLDVIQKVKAKSPVPVAAYNVSGEYAMVKFAAQAGVLDEKKACLEILTSIQRAGADIVLTYHAPEAAAWLNE